MIGLQTTKKFLSVALFVAVGAATLNIGRAQATVLTFDDITNDFVTQIPNGYGGFNWDNFLVLNTQNYPIAGYKNGTVSSPNVAFNVFVDPATVSVGSGTALI